MAMLDQQIEPLDQAVKAEAQRDKMALLLQTQPGVGAITALAYVLTLGDVSRFPRNKQVASCLGLIPREHSSGGRQKRRRSPYPAGCSYREQPMGAPGWRERDRRS